MRKGLATWLAAAVFMAVAGATAGWLLAGSDARAADITVYKSPTCGCCTQWVEHLRRHGFSVDIVDREDQPAVKAEFGVPQDLEACHTAIMGDYVIEGHVPAADIRRLQQEKPAARGLAVPGMPMGSPGMEQDGMRERFAVVLFDDGSRQVFTRY